MNEPTEPATVEPAPQPLDPRAVAVGAAADRVQRALDVEHRARHAYDVAMAERIEAAAELNERIEELVNACRQGSRLMG